MNSFLTESKNYKDVIKNDTCFYLQLNCVDDVKLLKAKIGEPIASSRTLLDYKEKPKGFTVEN